MYDHSIAHGVDDEELAVERRPRHVVEPRTGEAQHHSIAGAEQFEMIDAVVFTPEDTAHVLQHLLAVMADEFVRHALMDDVRVE